MLVASGPVGKGFLPTYPADSGGTKGSHCHKCKDDSMLKAVRSLRREHTLKTTSGVESQDPLKGQQFTLCHSQAQVRKRQYCTTFIYEAVWERTMWLPKETHSMGERPSVPHHGPSYTALHHPRVGVQVVVFKGHKPTPHLTTESKL